MIEYKSGAYSVHVGAVYDVDTTESCIKVLKFSIFMMSRKFL